MGEHNMGFFFVCCIDFVFSILSPNLAYVYPSHWILYAKLTSANRSKRAKSSFRIFTRSWAQYVDEMAVNPTMSAYRMLKGNARKKEFTWLSIMMASKLQKRINGISWSDDLFSPFFSEKRELLSLRSVVKREKFIFYRLLTDAFYLVQASN